MSLPAKSPPRNALPPIVAVATDRVRVGQYDCYAAIDYYPKAVVAGTDAIPMLIPAMGEDIDADGLMSQVDGLLLTGARANVHPSEYGAPDDPKTEPHDRHRDRSTLPLIRAALRHGVPMFAICRGLQELNVALGGTLEAEVHNVEGRDDHRGEVHDDTDIRYAIRHPVEVRPGGHLHDILGEATVQVNSVHHQAIDRLAEDLAIEATAPDGTIEAVRVRDAAGFALAVQWHPEYWVRTDKPSALLFAAFGRAVDEHRARRTG